MAAQQVTTYTTEAYERQHDVHPVELVGIILLNAIWVVPLLVIVVGLVVGSLQYLL